MRKRLLQVELRAVIVWERKFIQEIAMDENRQIPVALKVVAILFIVTGVCAVIEVVLSLMRSHININLGVLGLFVGYGLLRLRPGWRTCGLVFLWIGMIGVPVMAFIMLSGSGAINFSVFGQKVGRASKEFALVMAVVMFVLCVWQYRVLVRDDVRRLFGIGGWDEE